MAGDEVSEGGLGGGPEPERAVDVHPGVVARARVGDRRLEVVERAGVDLAGLGADDRRVAVAASASAEQLDPHPALSSTGTTSPGAPIPRRRSARVSVTWRFSPTMTRSGGAPARPFSGRS